MLFRSLGMEGKEQAQLIKGGILSFPCHQEAGEDEFCSVEYQQRTEVEIIAHTAGLVVVDGMFLLFSVFPFIMVGIDQDRFLDSECRFTRETGGI